MKDLADKSLIPAKTPKKRGSGKPFSKGQSGNPAGRPKLPDGYKERALAYSTDMLDVLHAIAIDGSKPAAARVSAASAILDRAHGKPTATVLASIGTLADLIAAADALPPPSLP